MLVIELDVELVVELDVELDSELDSKLDSKLNRDRSFKREILHQSGQHNQKYHKKRTMLESALIFCPY